MKTIKMGVLGSAVLMTGMSLAMPIQSVSAALSESSTNVEVLTAQRGGGGAGRGGEG